jgi:hypothetical protein
MSGDDRSLILWALASLMVAGERITTKFAGLVMADPTPEDRRRSLDEPLAG